MNFQILRVINKSHGKEISRLYREVADLQKCPVANISICSLDNITWLFSLSRGINAFIVDVFFELSSGGISVVKDICILLCHMLEFISTTKYNAIYKRIERMTIKNV
jgi:hypothetical protein